MTSVRIFWLLLCVLWVAAEIRLARRRALVGGDVEISETHSQRWLWLGISLGLLLSIMFKQLAWAPIPLPYLPRQMLAFTIFLGGLYLRYVAVIGLGRFFTTNVAIFSEHRLIVDGPYRWLRHPAYTGLLIALGAAGLAMGDGLALLSLLSCTGWALARRIEIEECLLEQQFGSAYRDYRAGRWRLLPWLY